MRLLCGCELLLLEVISTGVAEVMAAAQPSGELLDSSGFAYPPQHVPYLYYYFCSCGCGVLFFFFFYCGLISTLLIVETIFPRSFIVELTALGPRSLVS